MSTAAMPPAANIVEWPYGEVFQPKADRNYIVGYHTIAVEMRGVRGQLGTIVGCDYQVTCNITLDEAFLRVERGEWRRLTPPTGGSTLFALADEPPVGPNDPGGPAPWKARSRDVPRTTYGDAW